MASSGPLYFYVLVPFYMLSGSLTAGLNAGRRINLTSHAAARVGGGPRRRRRARDRDDGDGGAVRLAPTPILASPWNPHVIVLPTMALIVVSAAISRMGRSLAAGRRGGDVRGSDACRGTAQRVVVSAIALSVVLGAAVLKAILEIGGVSPASCGHPRRAGRVVGRADLGAGLPQARQLHESLAIFCGSRRSESAVKSAYAA